MVTRLAEIYVMVGDYDAAIGQLEIVLPLPSDMKVTVALLRVDPVWAPLRGNPRFERLLSP
jgi:serine/threonine-protein kinase